MKNAWFRPFVTALSMLSWIPVSRSFLPSEEDLARSGDWFPAVGAIDGAILFGFACLCGAYLPPLPAAAFLTVGMSLFSRGFHLDGLADTADGFLSSRPREKILEIMHDSRIGTMGVFAIVSVLMVKFACLAALAGTALFPFACGFAALSGRTGMSFYVILSGYARPDGLARAVFLRKPWTGLLTGLLMLAGADLFFTGVCFTALPVMIFVPLWAWYTHRVIGGGTGDTTGACCELSEAAALASVVLFQ